MTAAATANGHATREEATPEERFDAGLKAYVASRAGSFEESDATLELFFALNDRIDSLDAELGRLTDVFRALQGARS